MRVAKACAITPATRSGRPAQCMQQSFHTLTPTAQTADLKRSTRASLELRFET